MDLRYLIENEFDLFKDRHTNKRGPRHRRDGVGLNLDRKHQNIVADVHKADPNQVNEVERLRNLQSGRGFVNFKVGEQLRQKYGLQDDVGYLGTTGIKMIKTAQGYQLIKEAVVKIEGKSYTVNSPDHIWAKLPGTHVAFGIKNGIVYYLKGVGDTHINLLDKILTDTPGYKLQAYPKPSRDQFKHLVAQAENHRAMFNTTASERDIEDWGNNGNPRLFFDVTGRCNIDQQNAVAAFWNPTDKVQEQADLLRAFFTHIHTNPDPIIVTLDNKDTRLGQKVAPDRKINNKMLQKQHFVPAFKKALGASHGSGEVAKKASSAGYQTPAEFNAARIIGDSVNE
jgi:hypothetical protein